MHKILNILDLVISKSLAAIVRLYRVTLSPILGSNCRFHPTCSQYAIDALNKKPIITALPLIAKRISKCHPFHSGGYDPVK